MSTYVLGIDEVGRGPLAGPMTVAGVVFPRDHHPNPAITDSKKLSIQKRSELATFIKQTNLAHSLVDIPAKTIDQDGLTTSFCNAVSEIYSSIRQSVPGTIEVLIDGKPIPGLDIAHPVSFVVKGDQTEYAISAASIIAKVHRDHLMQQLAKKHPEYGWHTNVGYGTTVHRQAIIKHGPSPYHRDSFISKLIATKAV